MIIFRTLKLVPGDVPSLNSCHFMFTQKLYWKWKRLGFFTQAFPIYKAHHVLLEKCKSNFALVHYYIILYEIKNTKGHHCTWHIVGHLEMSLSSPSPSFTCIVLPLTLAQGHYAELQNSSMSALESDRAKWVLIPTTFKRSCLLVGYKEPGFNYWSFLLYLN